MAKFPVFMYGFPAGVPVGNHSRRLYIPVPPAMNSLAGAIRISFGCRKSAHNVWSDKECARKSIVMQSDIARTRQKKRARCQLSIEGLGGTIARKLSCALACSAPKEQNITRTDNYYTALNILLRGLQVFDGIKSCLPFIVMSVGYAELFSCKVSIIKTTIENSLTNI